MNYRNAAISELVTLAKETSEYEEKGVVKSLSIGQVVLAVLKRKPDTLELNEWLMNISDEDMYTEIEKTKIKERP